MTENARKRFAPEVRARAVRMVFEHQGDHATQWAAIGSIASKIGCSAETLRNWVRQAERDSGARAGCGFRSKAATYSDLMAASVPT
jgi:transposase